MQTEEKQKRNRNLLLIVALLALRFPLLYLGAANILQLEIAFVIYLCGTYILTALFIYRNRENLAAYHITPIALVIFLVAPLASVLAGNDYDPTLWFRIGFAVLFAAFLFTKGKHRLLFPRANSKKILTDVVLTVLLSVLVPIALHAIRGFPLIEEGNAINDYSGITYNWFYQLSSAAISEEPLFRGLLWGYLKSKGMKNLWICFLQAGLFWAGHIYYIGTGINFWIVHPLVALLLGLIVWKSKSITHSIVVHSSINTFADYLRFIRLF